MASFDDDRLIQININEVEPYAFWTWTTSNGRKGGMVCFRGQCRRDDAGLQDVRVVDWWMSEYYRECEIDSLVVDTWEFSGGWHDTLTFVPPVSLPDTFRVLYSVLPRYRVRACKLWPDCVRNDLESALSEIDKHLCSLPPKS